MVASEGEMRMMTLGRRHQAAQRRASEEGPPADAPPRGVLPCVGSGGDRRGSSGSGGASPGAAAAGAQSDDDGDGSQVPCRILNCIPWHDINKRLSPGLIVLIHTNTFLRHSSKSTISAHSSVLEFRQLADIGNMLCRSHHLLLPCVLRPTSRNLLYCAGRPED